MRNQVHEFNVNFSVIKLESSCATSFYKMCSKIYNNKYRKKYADFLWISTCLLSATAWIPPPVSRVQYLSCIVRMYQRFVLQSNSSWNVSWSDTSSWFAVTSIPGSDKAQVHRHYLISRTFLSNVNNKKF